MYSNESEYWMSRATEARDCCTWDEFRDRTRRPVPYGLYYLWQWRDGNLTEHSPNAIVCFYDGWQFAEKYVPFSSISAQFEFIWKMLSDDYPNQLKRELEARNARLKAEALDTAKRAAEKQASRDKDEADIASGKKTVEQVNQDNGSLVALGLKMDTEAAKSRY